jgi:hypothetical protein
MLGGVQVAAANTADRGLSTHLAGSAARERTSYHRSPVLNSNQTTPAIALLLLTHLRSRPAQEEEEERSAKEEEAELLALSAVQRYQMCAGKIPT